MAFVTCDFFSIAQMPLFCLHLGAKVTRAGTVMESENLSPIVTS